MYDIIKKAIKGFLPARLLHKLTPLLRSILAVIYTGIKVYCPVDNRSYSRFIAHHYIDHTEWLSPLSGVMARQRLLYLLLSQEVGFISENKVLHFSPNLNFARVIKQRASWHYVTTDFEKNNCDKQYDITAIDLPSDHLDVIICYHVLEHIPQDKVAMRELLRVLKPGGVAFLQVPFTNGETVEDASINTPALRQKHYWQADHVRLYGKTDFKAKLTEAGFEVKELICNQMFGDDEIKKFGLKADETVFLCLKPKATVE